MSYQSIDQLQKVLANNVFHHTTHPKKAAGRALGTLVEIITFYLLKTWGFENSITIEKGLAEYGNSEITHNVVHCNINIFNFSEGASADFDRLSQHLALWVAFVP